jgi:hypothetical protein
VGLAPTRLKQEVSQTRHLIPLLQTFPRAIEACSTFTQMEPLAKFPTLAFALVVAVFLLDLEGK